MPRRPVALAVLLAMAMGFSAAPARAIGTEALLDTLQHSAFQYFWTEANPANGLVKDRSTTGSVCSIRCCPIVSRPALTPWRSRWPAAT